MNIILRDLDYHNKQLFALARQLKFNKRTRLRKFPDHLLWFLRQIKHMLYRARIAYQSFIDVITLNRLYPELVAPSALVEKRSRLEPRYNEYVTQVSSAGMAISLELASFLYQLCEAVKPKTIADLGSGFSSFVLRTFAEATSKNVQVYSVDDDPHWLKKTAAFLKKHKLGTGNMMLWDEFRTQKRVYDIVLYDLGTMETRAKNLNLTVSSIRPNGVLIFDDMHFSSYQTRVASVAEKISARLLLLRKYTKDGFGRFAALMKR